MKYIILFSLVVSQLVLSQDITPLSPLDRVSPKLKIINEFVKNSMDMQGIDRIHYFDNENLRDQLRDLQNLFKLYTYTYDDPKVELAEGEKDTGYRPFKKAYNSTKKFEDFISHYRDRYHEQHDDPEAYEKIKEKYLAYIAKSKWFKLDDAGEFSKMIIKISNIFDEFELGTVTEDKDVLLHGFMSKIEQLSTKRIELDLTLDEVNNLTTEDKKILVEDNIHETRRDVRRIHYLNYGTTFPGGDKLVQRSYEIPCPMDGEYPAQAYHLKDYHPDSNYTCFVSSCLIDALDNQNSNYSSYRSYGAHYINNGDNEGLKEIFDNAMDSYDQLLDSNVYLHLRDQLLMCTQE
jgi:hypothetical protein